jgi:hypothetical protein
MNADISSDKGQSTPEQAVDFEKAEVDLLRENLRRSYKERFLMATRLYKVQLTMKKAVITHKLLTPILCAGNCEIKDSS